MSTDMIFISGYLVALTGSEGTSPCPYCKNKIRTRHKKNCELVRTRKESTISGNLDAISTLKRRNSSLQKENNRLKEAVRKNIILQLEGGEPK